MRFHCVNGTLLWEPLGIPVVPSGPHRLWSWKPRTSWFQNWDKPAETFFVVKFVTIPDSKMLLASVTTEVAEFAEPPIPRLGATVSSRTEEPEPKQFWMIVTGAKHFYKVEPNEFRFRLHSPSLWGKRVSPYVYIIFFVGADQGFSKFLYMSHYPSNMSFRDTSSMLVY